MEKWNIKNFFIISLICIMGAALLIVVPFIFLDIEIAKEFMKMLLKVSIVAFGSIFIIYIFSEGIVNIRKNIKQGRNKEYYREIDEHMTPALASIMIDDYIEKNEVILSCVLDLYVRKYLLVEIGNRELEIKVINQDYENLYSHEKYVIEAILNNTKIDFRTFINLVENDCVKNELRERHENEYRSLVLFFMFFNYVVIPIILMMTLHLFSENSLLIVLNLGISFISILIGQILRLAILPFLKNTRNTSLGKEEAKKFKKLKNYLNDYTLLDKQNTDYINIVDRYLPFALALGEAKKVKNICLTYKNFIAKYII